MTHHQPTSKGNTRIKLIVPQGDVNLGISWCWYENQLVLAYTRTAKHSLNQPEADSAKTKYLGGTEQAQAGSL